MLRAPTVPQEILDRPANGRSAAPKIRKLSRRGVILSFYGSVNAHRALATAHLSLIIALARKETKMGRHFCSHGKKSLPKETS